MRDFRGLKVWERAHRIVIDVYKLTTDFPAHEQYGLVSQLRRAAVSIPANIAEGCGRNSQKELHRFLEMALGSANELEYLFHLSKELGYTEKKAIDSMTNQIVEIKRMLTGLNKRLCLKGKSGV